MNGPAPDAFRLAATELGGRPIAAATMSGKRTIQFVTVAGGDKCDEANEP
jgi:hypothetical protein